MNSEFQRNFAASRPFVEQACDDLRDHLGVECEPHEGDADKKRGMDILFLPERRTGCAQRVVDSIRSRTHKYPNATIRYKLKSGEPTEWAKMKRTGAGVKFAEYYHWSFAPKDPETGKFGFRVAWLLAKTELVVKAVKPEIGNRIKPRETSNAMFLPLPMKFLVQSGAACAYWTKS